MSSDKVVKISDNIYTMDEVIRDLTELKEHIEDIVFITFLHDGTATVSHTGLKIQHAALAAKLLDVEFNNLVHLQIDEDEE